MKPPPEKPAFDAYSADYADLIRDPIRDKFAASDRFFCERKLQVIQDFYRRIGVDTRDLRWLDVGCGQGDLLRAGKSYFGSAAGCDPSEGMLKSCQDLDVKHQPAPDLLPFESNSFDFITTVCVYHHIEEDRRSLFTSEVVRLLKPGGIVCVIEHNPLNPVTRLIVSRTPVDADASLLTARRTRAMLSNSGVKILKTHYFLLLPEFMYRHFGFIENRLMSQPIGGQYSVFASRPGFTP
jgi:SAM-dependent methyltransferase